MNVVRISMSAIGPKISEQCAELGLTAGMPMKLLDDLSRAITMCRIHGVLTSGEVDKARNRLMKAAQFEKAAQRPPQSIASSQSRGTHGR